MNKPDPEIKSDVEAELRWCPEIDETDIAIKVNQGVVALTGFVRTYYEKYRAEAIVKQVTGVAGVANDIEVQLAPGRGLTDPQIAREAVEALRAPATAFRVVARQLIFRSSGYTGPAGRRDSSPCP